MTAKHTSRSDEHLLPETLIADPEGEPDDMMLALNHRSALSTQSPSCTPRRLSTTASWSACITRRTLSRGPDHPRGL